jgi:hypothetical protein
LRRTAVENREKCQVWSDAVFLLLRCFLWGKLAWLILIDNPARIEVRNRQGPVTPKRDKSGLPLLPFSRRISSGPYPSSFHRVQQTIQSVTGRLRMNTPYQIEARKYWVEADLYP